MAKQFDKPNSLDNLKLAIREKNIGNFYIFHGEETFLLHQYLEKLRKMLVDPLTESFNHHKFNEENFDIRSFADAVECLPMMAERTFIVVDDVSIFGFNEADKEKLSEILSDIPEYCTLIFTYETVKWKPEKDAKSLWKTISANAEIVEFAKQDHRDLINWITRHFAANQKSIDPKLCTYLIEITGGTMTALAGEISKICAYSGADRITKSDIDAVTEPVMDAVVFQMTDMLGEGNYGGALLKLRQLIKMQNDPIVILGAIGAHFRKLSAARILMDNGKTSDQLMTLYSMKDYPARKLMGATKRFSAEFCEKAAALILETDYRMKNSYSDGDTLLEQLILQLAEVARNG